ncbi:quinone oxidoreductase family protein [Rhodococcus opacus]|uniref:quinone oxidoreductase family protein n=1 Tax=Rhodococcus TaxID=1827 RepID=UPI0002A334D7|nr:MULTISPECIES: zinc-binding dehydrogenase [Rhodococcus]ELB94034.1 zinc binding alcohol dehydrogenase [Rhodococcus wratislaviensis IFP 2016]MBA8964600.1 NADPH:quinone reductase-like Zn-dependent oxidoreductase [Rhodococcus opacus]MBP2207438.1 NADPH:quinone reductase-like Zn-dependent oxidoreductase [Rhodococcus opacus]MDI9941419.1 zinc-binding dehydrogenase [Rhodococcus sp. IEGM 1351]MDJ0417956.1 zinc-binding dehydrogenase [Rhodococcus opacus]
MRAARFHTFGHDPIIDDVEVPTRKPGQTLVRIDAAALGHLDLTVGSGNFDIKPALPHVGGTDGAGTVIESDIFDASTRVLVRGGGVGLFKPGCWAEYLVAADKVFTPFDSALEPAIAATFFLPSTTGFVAVHDIARVTAGERVLVAGAAGAVGSMAAQFALLAGADVIGVVPRADQVPLVPNGVRPVVGRGRELADTLGPDPVADVLVDTLGGDSLPYLLERVVPGGRAALIGYTLGTELTIDLPNWLLKDVQMLPVNMIRKSARQAELAADLIRRLVDGEIGMAVQEFPLDDIAFALQMMREGKVAGRAVVVP